MKLSNEEIGSLVLDVIIDQSLANAIEKHLIVWREDAAEEIGAAVRSQLARRWKDDPPSELGWYWFWNQSSRRDTRAPMAMRPNAPPVVLLVGSENGFLCCRFPQVTMKVSDMEGRWCGPMRPPQ